MSYKTLRNIGFGFVLIFLLTTPLSATQTPYTFNAIGDTFIHGYEHPDTNEGTATSTRIQHPPRSSNVMVNFSLDDLQATVGERYIVSAVLKLYIETNFNNWPSGGAIIELHRMLDDWTETGATWNCPDDSNTGNSQPDCDLQWSGGTYDDVVSASIVQYSAQTGWRTFDVTSDVQIMVGSGEGYGWIIRKQNYNDTGSVDFTSVQGTAIYRPVLVVTTDDQISCTPTAVEQVFPDSVPANGANNTITVIGEGLDNLTQILINGTPLSSFTLVDSSTVTFLDSSSSATTKTITFKSNCLSAPLDAYYVDFYTGTRQQQSPQVTCAAHAGATWMSLGHDTDTPTANNYICYHEKVDTINRQVPIQLVGSGPLQPLTIDTPYVCRNTNNTTACINDTCMSHNIRHTSSNGICNSANIPDTVVPKYSENARWVSQETGIGHGSNLARIWVFGHSNSAAFDKPESMPFTVSSGKYQVAATSATSGPELDGYYENRLIELLTSAYFNGQVIQLTLFEHWAVRTGHYTDQQGNEHNPYFGNPWNPFNSNLGTAYMPSSSTFGSTTDGGDQFFKICNKTTAPVCHKTSCQSNSACGNADLSTLGWAEKNLVTRIMSIVRHGCTATGCPNNHSFPNVFIELMNEPSKPDDLPNATQDFNEYVMWHRTVANWVRGSGKYIISVNPFPEADANGTVMNQCTSASNCLTNNNQYYVAFMSKAGILALHHAAWADGICNGTHEQAYYALSTFKRPVIIDDDGAGGRSNNNNVQDWLDETFDGSCTDASHLHHGMLHFDHLEEGIDQPTSGFNCTPTNEQPYIDCQQYDILGDYVLDDLCAMTLKCPSLSGTQYCVQYCSL